MIETEKADIRKEVVFVEVGISSACLYPMETSEALECLLERGFRHFEIFFNTYREIQPEYLCKLQGLLYRYGATVPSIHPFTSVIEGMLLFSNYHSRTLDGLDFYEQYFAAARRLGAQFLILHGQRLYPRGTADLSAYVDGFQRLSERAAKYGITVCQENVSGFASQDLHFISGMREALGDCAFALDIKQAVRAGADPFAMAAAMGPLVRHVHLNDHRPGQDCLVPFQGQMDYLRFFRQLRSQGFDGEMIIEVYRSNFTSLDELWQAKQKTESLLQQL